MRRGWKILFLLLITGGMMMCCTQKTQRYVNTFFYSDLEMDTSSIPEKNKKILLYAEQNGSCISPTYKAAVCTEYLISVLNNVHQLTNDQKRKIRIITNEDLDSLIRVDAPVIKGVYYALTSTQAGIPIDDMKDVQAGDLVQFWNTSYGRIMGHCGVVRAVDPDKGLLSLYSSSQTTNGHGKQLYVLPQKSYFVRLK